MSLDCVWELRIATKGRPQSPDRATSGHVHNADSGAAITTRNDACCISYQEWWYRKELSALQRTFAGSRNAVSLLTATDDSPDADLTGTI